MSQFLSSSFFFLNSWFSIWETNVVKKKKTKFHKKLLNLKCRGNNPPSKVINDGNGILNWDFELFHVAFSLFFSWFSLARVRSLKEKIFAFQREFARRLPVLFRQSGINKLALNCWGTGETREGCCRNLFSQHTIWFGRFFLNCQFENW